MKAMGCYFIMCWAVCSVSAGTLQQTKNYQVDRVTKVISPLEFECKLKDFPYAKSARFKVTIQNLNLSKSAVSDDKAAQFLQTNLDSADTIRLRNVKVRNYFRLSADVFIDNKDLVDTYVKANLGTAVLPPEKDRQPQKPKPEIRHSSAKRPPENRISKPTSLPAANRMSTQTGARFVSLDQLLNTEVDLSMINADTTLAEALDIMRRSVRPNLPLLVLWNDLENNAMIDKDQPIGISGFGRMKLATAMKVIMNSISTASGSNLVLVPEGRVLTLGTRRGLNYKPVTRVYSITDLTLPPSFSNEFGRGAGSASGSHSSGRSGRNNSSSGSSNSGR
ncbi:MAG: hypothetical protein ACYTET_02980 [Planctomycetota bacterium]|jgi:hypothetical protein